MTLYRNITGLLTISSTFKPLPVPVPADDDKPDDDKPDDDKPDDDKLLDAKPIGN